MCCACVSPKTAALVELDEDCRISFPHMGDYHVLFRDWLAMSGCEIITPPPITRRTLELGTKHSPDSVCVPFKYILGNYLEAIELGANTFCTIAGGCRFEYYFEVHRQILRDLGHKVRFIRISQSKMYSDFHAMNPRLGRLEFISRFLLLKKKIHLFDHLADLMRKRIGFETKKGSFKRFWRRFLSELAEPLAHRAFNRYARKAEDELMSIPVDKPDKPLRVGIIGELYILMEPFSNFRLEEGLAKMGVEVYRWVTVSSIIHHGVNGARAPAKFLRWAKPYARYHVGAHGTESIARLHRMIKDGFDGAMHLKPFSCMPEINALPALHKMSRDHQFPLACFSFDSHTSETGMQTRLEAFFDMIYYKRQGALV